MAFLTPAVDNNIMHVDNNIIQNLIYLRPDIPACVSLTDNNPLKHLQHTPQLLNSTHSNASNFTFVNTASPNVDNLTKHNDLSVINHFNSIEDKHDSFIESALSMNTSPQQQLVFSYIPQTSLPIRSEADINSVDFNFPLIESNREPFHDDLAALVTNDVTLSSAHSSDNAINLNGAKASSVCESKTNQKKSQGVSTKKPAGENIQNESETGKEVVFNNKEEGLTRCPGRPRKDGTSLYSIKKWKKCGDCDKKYLTAYMMRKHIREQHPDTFAKLTCKTCEKTFDSEEKLVLHAADHWKPREKCPFGGSSLCIKFSTKTSLRAHLCRYHIQTSSNERPYPCRLCIKCFDKPSQLKRHMRIHIGEKLYECSECNKRFTQKISLVVHMRTHNKHYPHKCQLCKAAFSQSYNLTIHIFKIHFKYRKIKGSVQCEKCSNVFPDSKSAFKHYMRSHKDSSKTYLTENLVASSRQIKKRKMESSLRIENECTNKLTPSECSKSLDISSKNHIEDMVTLEQKKDDLLRMDNQSNPSDISLNEAEKILQEIDNTMVLHQPSENRIENLGDFSDINVLLSEIGIRVETTDPLLSKQMPTNDVGYPGEIIYALPSTQNFLETNLTNRHFIGNSQISIDVLSNNYIVNQPLFFTHNILTDPNVIINDGTSTNSLNTVDNHEYNISGNIFEKSLQINSDQVIIDGIQHIANENERQNIEKSIVINNLNLSACESSGTNDFVLQQQGIPELIQIKRKDKESNSATNSTKNYTHDSIVMNLESDGVTNVDHGSILDENEMCLSSSKKTEETGKKTSEKIKKNVLRAFKPKKAAKQCTQCDASFKKLSDMQRHYRTHTNERPFVCTVCNASFTLKSSLKKHTDNPNIHNKSKKIIPTHLKV